MKMAKSVEEYFEINRQYILILQKLRTILLSTELVETVKWGMPTYTINGRNIIGIGAFKSYAGIWFFHGVFLKDDAKKLVNAQEGKTQGMRQWHFDSIDDVDESLVLTYIEEAIQNQKDGKEIRAQKKPLIVPDELQEELASDSQLSEAFDNLSLSSKRDYSEYIETAKKEETRLRRLDKIIPMIRDGIGLNDQYN